MMDQTIAAAANRPCPYINGPEKRCKIINMANLDTSFKRDILIAMAEAVLAGKNELTRLDQAIGDGDHGLNMERGFAAVRAEADVIAAKALPQALHALGMTLVMNVGGASGPLYGTLAMALGAAIPLEPSFEQVISALGHAVEAVKRRGRSDAGQKTLLDVLIPVHRLLASEGFGGLAHLSGFAANAADATRPLMAIRGRAACLGERSIGHVDPGARSASLIVSAIARVFIVSAIAHVFMDQQHDS